MTNPIILQGQTTQITIYNGAAIAIDNTVATPGGAYTIQLFVSFLTPGASASFQIEYSLDGFVYTTLDALSFSCGGTSPRGGGVTFSEQYHHLPQVPFGSPGAVMRVALVSLTGPAGTSVTYLAQIIGSGCTPYN